MSELEGKTPGAWLTVTEAAARHGVSEKTLRKRIAAGQVRAHKQTLPTGGWAWRVAPVGSPPVGAVGSRDGSRMEGLEGAVEAVRSTSETVMEDETVPVRSRLESAAEGLPTVPTAAPDSLTAHLLEENRFLRAQVEQHARTAAEATAAVRELTRALNNLKALPSPDASGADSSAPNAPQSAPEGKTGQEAGQGEKGRERGAFRALRPLWKVLLGVR